VASAAYGLCLLARPGHDLKYGAVVAMVVVHVAVSSLQWVVDLVAMLERQQE